MRHHAPSLSAVLPALLDAAKPEVVLVELPAEFQPWLGWLADEATEAPVALAAAPAGPDDGPDGGPGPGPGRLAFYPFADFSPELVALRWARRNGVEVLACDLPLAHRTAPSDGDRHAADTPDTPGVADALRRRLTGRDSDDDLWDRLVETAAPGSAPDAVRRAALLVGWALRRDAETGPGVNPYDLRREAWMRARIRARRRRTPGRRRRRRLPRARPARRPRRHRRTAAPGPPRTRPLPDPLHLPAARRPLRLPGGHPRPRMAAHRPRRGR